MKRIIKYGLFSIFAFMFVACGDKGSPSSTDDNEIYVWPDSIKQVYLIPDSLRTPEEDDLYRDLQRVRYEYTDIADGQLVFKMTFEEFKKTGIAEPYFHLLVSRTKQYNRFLNKWNTRPDTVSDAWEKKKEKFRRELLEMPNE